MPVTDAPLTLEQRLARFDSARHGGEVMASKTIGAERCKGQRGQVWS